MSAEPERSWDDLVEENERGYGTSWIPKQGQGPRTLMGTVTGWDFVVTDNIPKGAWVVGVIDPDSERWNVWLFGRVLREEFAKFLPQKGERIVLRYRGTAEKASRPGYTPAELYTLTVDRDQPAVEMPTAAQLTVGDTEEGGERRRDLELTGQSDLGPDDSDEFAYGQQRPPADADVTDAEVIEDKPKDDKPKDENEKGKDDDEPIPF